MILAGAGDVQWGTVSQWLSGAGTVGALFWAVGLYVGQRRDRRRAQARQVAAWCESVDDVDTAPGIPFTVMATIVVRNGSDGQVFNVGLMLDRNWLSDRDPQGYNLLIGPIPPGREQTHEVPLVRDEDLIPLASLPPVIELVFTDESEQHWHRRDGRLTRLRDNPLMSTC